MAAGDEGEDPSKRYTVGYALEPKKEQSFIRPSLLSQARSHGIDLIKIDPDLPLDSQGPFNCLLHKISTIGWRLKLESFSSSHPETLIIDLPASIERLHDRISMLQVVSELDTCPSSETFGIPSQVVVRNADDLSDQSLVGHLQFPIIAKPLVADGSVKSHKMSLVFTRDGLLRQKPPLVLQEFVNHGGVIFKVYVVGAHVCCVRRKSLPDVSKETLESPSEETVSFSQISNLTGKTKQEMEEEELDEAEMPPDEFVKGIAKGLRRALNLRLFNFDMIRDAREVNRYLIIDINYFPGYAKMPDYERVLTEFFVKVRDGEEE